MDQFIDNNHNGVFDAGDTYTAPTAGPPPNPGTGYSVAANYGTEMELKSGSPPQLSPGWFQALDINPPGANGYRAAIGHCINSEYGIGDIVPIKHGNMSGPTSQGVANLLSLNGNSPATWDSVHKKILNNCVDTHTCLKYDANGNIVADPNASLNPQIVPVPVYDPALFASTGQIKITNIFGFFVERDNGHGNNSSVWGILVNVPGFVDAAKGSVGTPSAFLKTIYLVR